MNVMKYRTYSKYEKDQSRFEVRFQRLMDLEDYLCSCENDESINVTMCADETRGYRIDYPFVIKQKPLYGLCPAIYIIEVFAKNLKELGLPAGWGTCIDVQEVEDSGNFYVKRSDRYYVKTDHYGLFPTYEGHYRFRTYKPAWNTVPKKEDVDHLFESIASNFGVPKGCTERWFEETKDEIYKHYMEKNFGVTKDDNKSYMLCARGNGKGVGQLLEAIKHHISTGKPIVAVNPKHFYGLCPAEPTIKFSDLDEKTLKYIDTDIATCIELTSNLPAKELKELKERMNMMFGVDLNMIPEIKDVKFNNPATIVFWADGTKTVVKRQKGDRFDKEKGLAMAIVKKLYGNKGKYNDLFKKWIKEDK